jgi:hypothetical protein
MTPKTITRVVAILLCILVAGCWFNPGGRNYVFRFTEAQLQEKLDARMPITKNYLHIFQMTLSHPRLHLEDGSNRIKLSFDITLNTPMDTEFTPLTGSIDASSGIRYDSTQEALFLTDPKIEHSAIQGIPDKYMGKTDTALSTALAAYYTQHPVYTLKATDFKQMTGRLTLKNVTIENRNLVVTLGI